MSVTSKVFGNFLKCALNKEVNLGNGATGLKVMLLTSSASIDQDTWIYKSSATNEVTGTGYTTGGSTLTNVTVSYSADTNTIKIDADDVVWSASTLTARYAIIYDSIPSTDATRPLIGYIDFGADMSSSSGNFSITWDTAGIFTISTN